LLYSDSSDLGVADPNSQMWLRSMPRGGFSLDLSSLENLNPWGIGLKTEQHKLCVDLHQLFREVCSAATIVTGSRCSRIVILKKPNGSSAEVHLTRERRPGQFPIKTFVLRCEDNVVLTLTMFYVYPQQTGEGVPLEGAPLRSLTHLFALWGDKGFFREATLVEGIPRALAAIIEALQGRDAKKLTGGPETVVVAKRLLAELTPTEQLTQKEQRYIRMLLAHMLCSVEKTVGDSPSRIRALENLFSFLAKRVVEPVRIEYPKELDASDESCLDRNGPWCAEKTGVPAYIAGHERWRTAQRLEIVAGPELTKEIYVTLQRLIVDAKADREARLCALDLLGELGVHPVSRLLMDLETSLKNEKDAAICGAFASVKVRAGTPDEMDVARLKTMEADDRLPRWLRLVALEALMLLDETTGRRSRIIEIMDEATMDCRDYATRCLFAAGCCQEGRDVLRSILVKRAPMSLLAPAMFLVETSIGPEDVQWNDCLTVAKAIALDEKQPLDLRIKAAQFAHRGAHDQTFNDQFIRATFRTEQLRLLHYTGAVYLPWRSSGQRYLDEFGALMDSPIPDVRKAAAMRLFRCLPLKLSTDEQHAVVGLLRKMQSNDDSEVRLRSVAIWSEFRYAKETFADELIPGYLRMAQQEKDVIRFIDIVLSLGFGLGQRLDLPCNFACDDNGPIPREEVRRLGELYRDRILAQVEAWVREVP
jgi:hypothetical protein